MKLLARYGVFPLLPVALQQGLRRVRGVAPAVREPLAQAMLTTLKERRARYPQRRGTAVHGRSQRELVATLNDAFTAQILERIELRNALAGLEIRHPMYDYRFVQFAFATPARLRVQGNVRKVIHRQALEQHMPRAILERNTKAEFSSVFRAKLDTMKEVLTQEIPRRHGDWANAEEMSALYEAYQGVQQSGRIEWTLWSIYACDLVFET
jgi:asparagine synthase (glutamine-hydrolysing)